MMVRLFALLACLLMTAAAPLPSWVVDQPRSRLGFSAAMNGERFSGMFTRWTARIRFDPNNLGASRVVVVIDMASARTGDQTRDEALPTADWFAAALVPRATFQASRFQKVGPDRYEAIGTLTIRKIARPATLRFSLSIKGNVATMRGSATIDRREFGIGQGQFATGETVATGVVVDVVVSARKAP